MCIKTSEPETQAEQKVQAERKKPEEQAAQQAEPKKPEAQAAQQAELKKPEEQKVQAEDSEVSETWAHETIQELLDFWEEQGVYIRE